MKKSTIRYKDADFMYKFCTKRCFNKKCKQGITCLGAHCKANARRTPEQVLSNDGLFNYIPKACPEYKKLKKCSMGKSCHLAHGWLEVIFHPLLFKTKLCGSTLKKGVCSKYGVYCAKAHNKNEIRNLVTIYGEHWKRHYEVCQMRKPAKLFSSKKTRTQQKNRVGLAKPPKSQSLSIADRDSDLNHDTSSDSLQASRPASKADQKGELCMNKEGSGFKMVVCESFPDLDDCDLNHDDRIDPMYGGSPLFAPFESPSFESITERSEQYTSPKVDPMPPLDIKLIAHKCGSEKINAYTELYMNVSTSSLFDKGAFWALDWCSSQISADSKESDTSSSGSLHSSPLSNLSSSADQNLERCKTKRGLLKKMVDRGLPDFDQQDREFKLCQRCYESDINAALIVVHLYEKEPVKSCEKKWLEEVSAISKKKSLRRSQQYKKTSQIHRNTKISSTLETVMYS